MPARSSATRSARSQLGWTGPSNGQLLATAGGRFDVLITMDKRMPLDRDLSQYQVGVVLVRAGSTDSTRCCPWSGHPGRGLHGPAG